MSEEWKPDDRRAQRRVVLRFASWVGAWVLLTIVGAGVNAAAWWPQAAGGPAIDGIKPASNFFQLMAAPGWAVIRVVTRGWPSSRVAVHVAAHGMAWAGWLGVFAVALLVRRRWIGWVCPVRHAGADTGATPALLSRRRFLVEAPGAAVGLVGACGAVRATLMDPWNLKVRTYRVTIRDLPPGLDGVRFVQLSDTHLGPRVPAAFIARAVRAAVALRPTVVLLTGDYIHNGSGHIAQAAALFQPLRSAAIPTVAVLGNHDWYGDGPAMARALQGVGVRMVDNGRVYLDARARALTDELPEAGSLCIAGVGDLLEDVVDADAALAGVPGHVPRLLLAHNPDTAEHAGLRRAGHRIDLMLSGHTHGGQVRLPLLGTPLIPSRYGRKYAGGLVQGPVCPVIVSRGIGMSLVPVRFGVPPEVVLIELVRA